MKVTKAIDFEKAVLGAMLIDNKATEKAIHLLAKDFYVTKHQIIFETIVKIFCNGEPIDIITVSDKLREQKKFDEIGTADYLTELVNSVLTTSNVSFYIDKIKDVSLQRTAELNTQKFIQGDITRQELMISLEEIVKEKQQIIKLSDQIDETYDHIKKIMDNDKSAMGLSTGYYDIDKIIRGMSPGKYIIIAGRPSMGKTSLALNICQKVASKEKRPVLFISLETMAENLIMRLIYAQSKVSENKVLDGYAGKNEKVALEMGVGVLKELGIYIYDDADLNTVDIRVLGRQFKRKHPDLALIVIDYLQQIKTPKAYESEAREVSNISMAINRMAKELKTPVIALAQLNRELEKRIEKRPRLSDLKSSGQLEQDADIVMMMYRDIIYNPLNREDEKWQKKDRELEVAIVKNREGRLGFVKLVFFADEKRIESEVRGF